MPSEAEGWINSHSSLDTSSVPAEPLAHSFNLAFLFLASIFFSLRGNHFRHAVSNIHIILHVHECPIALIVSCLLDAHCILKALLMLLCVHFIYSFWLWQSVSKHASSTCTHPPPPTKRTPASTNNGSQRLHAWPYRTAGGLLWGTCLGWRCWVIVHTYMESHRVLLFGLAIPVRMPLAGPGIPLSPHPTTTWRYPAS